MIYSQVGNAVMKAYDVIKIMRENRNWLGQTLRSFLNSYSLDLAECGKRIVEPPEISREDGTLVKRGLYGKPPRWFLHLINHNGKWQISLPPHAQSHRLGYFNAQGGRSIGGLSFTVQLAYKTKNGWQIIRSAEWVLFVLRTIPFPSGTSSETIDNYSPADGTMCYQDDILDFEYSGLVSLSPPSTRLVSSSPTLSVKDANSLLSGFLHMRTYNMTSHPKSIPVFDITNKLGRQGFRTTINNIPSDVPTKDFDKLAQEEKKRILKHVEDYRKKTELLFLDNLRRMKHEEFVSFMSSVLTSMGYEGITFKESNSDTSFPIRGLATKWSGNNWRSTSLVIYQSKPSIGAELVADASEFKAQTSYTLIITTGTFTKGVYKKMLDLDHKMMELLDGSELCQTCLTYNRGFHSLDIELPVLDVADFKI